MTYFSSDVIALWAIANPLTTVYWLILIGILASGFFAYLSAKLKDETTTVDQVDLTSFPARIRSAFEETTPAVQRAGFRLIGDFFTVRRGIKMYDRKFFDPSQTVVADIGFCAGYFSRSGPNMCLISVFDDGTYLESSSHDAANVPDYFMVESALVVNPCNSFEVSELIRLHQLAIDKIVRERNSTILTLSKDLIPKLVLYSLQLADWQMHRGGVWEKPPAPQLVNLSGDEDTALAVPGSRTLAP